MTGYINWMATTQPSKDGTFNMEGNVVADYVTVASGNTSPVAPEGAIYATINCTVDSTVEANIISQSGQADGQALYNAKQLFCPAGVPVQIPNIVVGKTTITVTDV